MSEEHPTVHINIVAAAEHVANCDRSLTDCGDCESYLMEAPLHVTHQIAAHAAFISEEYLLALL